jgi:hypothetical protein
MFNDLGRLADERHGQVLGRVKFVPVAVRGKFTLGYFQRLEIVFGDRHRQTRFTKLCHAQYLTPPGSFTQRNFSQLQDQSENHVQREKIFLAIGRKQVKQAG